MTTATARTTTLAMSPDLALPLEGVTQTFGILSKRGMGKTYTALVLAEEMLKAGLQVVIADPIGVTFGLRSSADGKAPGLPITILGGDHADVPLNVAAGSVVADLVIDEQLSAVLDLSLFRKGEQVRFMTDFAERLYHRNRAPLHLILDEADAFAPQRPIKGQERMLGAIEDLVRRGRARGIGVTLVTQRAAVLNKDVLTQVEVLVALRTIAPQDREAIDAWIRVHGTPEQRAELMESLPSLPIGTAWFWSPGWLDIFQRVQVRKRETFDSSATPAVGQMIASPKELAPIDLARIESRLATVIEQARADDPRELRRRIAELEHQLREQKPAAAAEKVIERVEVPVLQPMQIAALVNETDRMVGSGNRLQETGEQLISKAEEILAVLTKISAPEIAAMDGKPIPLADRRPVRVEPSRVTTPVTRISRLESESASGFVTNGVTSDVKLMAGERRMLSVLASFLGESLTRAQLALLTGFTATGGGFRNYVANLKKQGLVREASGLIALEDAGRELAGPVAPLQTTGDLIGMWKESLMAGERRMLDELVDRYPDGISRADLAERTGFEPTGGGFRNYVANLKKVGLAVEERGELSASPTLFLEEG